MYRVSGVGVRAQDSRPGDAGFNTLRQPKYFGLPPPPRISGFGFRVAGFRVSGILASGFGLTCPRAERRKRRRVAVHRPRQRLHVPAFRFRGWGSGVRVWCFGSLFMQGYLAHKRVRADLPPRRERRKRRRVAVHRPRQRLHVPAFRFRGWGSGVRVWCFGSPFIQGYFAY